MKLLNIVNFEIDYAFQELKLRLEQVPAWQTSQYKPEEKEELENGHGSRIQTSRGFLTGLFEESSLKLEIDDVTSDRLKTKIRATVEYAENLQRLFQEKDSRFKPAVQSIDKRLLELISSLNGRILTD